MKIRIKRVGTHDLPVPKYETEGAAGFDLRAVVIHEKVHARYFPSVTKGGVHMLWLNSGESIALSVGFAFEVPDGYELQVRGRSGLAFKHHIVACHSPGTVDADYRGEVSVKLWNLGTEPFLFSHGDRIAQGVIAPVVRAEFEEVAELSETARGAKGFGSTGV